MVKRALCVGINKYPRADLELRGCVNDAKAWASLLVDHYDFARPDVRVITDAKATKRNVLAALEDLLARSAKGDVLVFTNSSHGTYVADTDGDESLYDEAICPYDCETDLIVDDELRDAASPGSRRGCGRTVISDSCHSGSVTREPPLETPDRRAQALRRPDRPRTSRARATSAAKPARGARARCRRTT